MLLQSGREKTLALCTYVGSQSPGIKHWGTAPVVHGESPTGAFNVHDLNN